VSLAQRVVFLWRFTYLCAAFPGKNLVWCYERRPGKNNALGQAHSPAIELRLKTAPLAGLFRSTGHRFFTDRGNNQIGSRILTT
jgi:hypothetical protein